PSRFTSTRSIKLTSTALQACTQDGNDANDDPTTCVYTSYLISNAKAGAMKYSNRIKNKDQQTERRASTTDEVVYERIKICGIPAVPSIRHSTNARKLLRIFWRSSGSLDGNGSACGTGGEPRASWSARACDQAARAAST